MLSSPTGVNVGIKKSKSRRPDFVAFPVTQQPNILNAAAKHIYDNKKYKELGYTN